MPRPKRVTCRACDRHIDVAGPLSARGKCEDCSLQLQSDAITQVLGGRGPVYDRWLSNTTAGIERRVREMADRNR